MIPLHDDNPTRKPPVVTITLILINFGVFFYQLLLGIDVSAISFGLIPAELTQDVDRVYTGGELGLPRGTRLENFDPAWATIFTSMFMHGSWLHIIGNMWYLWIFGNNVEDQLGKFKFILFYLVSGIAAAGAQILMGFESPIPMVGASGALAGVLGAYLVMFPGSRVLCLVTWIVITTIQLPASLVLGFWFVLQVISQLVALGPQAPTGGVAYAAHIGGFIAGWLIIKLAGGGERRPPRRHVREPDFMDWR